MKLSEYTEQVAFVEYLDILKTKGEIVMFTAIPNNTWTPSWGQKIKNKKAGLNPGFPDLLIILVKRVICIELKVRPNKMTTEQEAWGRALNEHGIRSYLAYGFDGAKEIIDNEIKNN